MGKASDKPYIKALDSLRVISISAVVLIHTTTRTIEATGDNLIGFPWTLFLNQIGRFSVPLFFIVSGFALELNYDYHINYFTYLKKRFTRVLIPFVFWSAVYYFFVYTKNDGNFFKSIFLGSASYQLYFIPSLIIFYLLFPLFHKFYNILANKWVFLSLIISETLLLSKDYYIKEIDLPAPIRIAILAYVFFIAGMMAAKNKERLISFTKRWKTLVLPFTVASGIYVFLEGLTKFITTGNYLTFYSTWRPSVMVFSFAFALIFFYIFDKSHLQFSVAKKLSNLSFFVFFIHVIILEAAWRIFGSSLFNSLSASAAGKFIFDPIFFAVVIFVSFTSAFLIRKIPYLYKITG